ncbi:MULTISPECIES: type VII secretion target [Mycolicibacterium]|uniref:type VII secretion target n=1 Tax=Mycolicibacterium TaxID=1866885 RepID=UPI001ABF6EBF|nr:MULTISPECIES: type VII secretion target [Mycolicibacterium]QRZ06649.1 hypothetical protein JN090_27915 [Mycolicibacterium austroafricanum]QZT68133.1 hypothetical protein JN086_27440 [Mycolicibacterium austroafricanum]
MGVLKVDPAALELLADRCAALASDLGSLSAPTTPGSSYQATAAAVAEANVVVASATSIFGERLMDTAESLSTSAARYAERDALSGDVIRTVQM